MYHALLALLLVAAMPAAQATGTPTRLNTTVPGAPGTPTPTPYPQITPSTPPKAYNGAPGAPLLPPMPVPGPPKDQDLPGLRQETGKPPVQDDR
ncbi:MULTISPECIES: hypothetical protein [Pseudomonas]|uniref:Lipoprotein n=1 Tax=Pseudomonas promysalinigenes TaxID=485898 RepID=A0ABY6AHU5_9PSED|nr:MULTISPECIES: hypothetical protein [Pseudomonas]QXI32680.1 hypothetical protein HU725_016860 [Pseudomonas promysalinigenes]UXH38867.1 hypothetical protein N5C08_18095 [Pseudomonas promysalinigenes]